MNIARTTAAAAIFALVFAGFGAAPSARAGQRQESQARTLKAPVDVRYDATIGGAQIAKGEYQGELVEGTDLVLVLWKGKREVARVRVDRRDLPTEAPHGQVSYNLGSGGEREIVGVTFKKQRAAFVVSGASQVANAARP